MAVVETIQVAALMARLESEPQLAAQLVESAIRLASSKWHTEDGWSGGYITTDADVDFAHAVIDDLGLSHLVRWRKAKNG